jgi:phosphate transport system substrate-binding protein
MHNQKILAALSLILVVVLLATMSGNVVTATSNAQATAAATSSGMDIPGTGKITGPADGEANALNGAGATFPVPLYTKWFSEYEKLTRVKINYQGVGSGGGIKGIQDQTLDFGASDGFMSDEQLKAAKGGPILHIATALGGVVLVYNVPEATEPIKLTPETLAMIYLGESGGDATAKIDPLLKWNDPRLVADNPQLANVDKNIFVVHRSDASGTSNIFTSYLSAVNEKWAKNVGAANAVNWPVGLGGKGNAGVAGNVRQAPYTIGYVEQAYADQIKLQTAVIKNKAGKFVASSAETVSAAAAGVKLPADLRVKIVNADGENAYPISGFTWLLVYETQTDPAKALTLARVIWWATHDGQKFNADLGYAPLPVEAIMLDEAQIAKIMINGKPALPADIMAKK